jgi:Protein of unknown function (DUF2742)
MTKQKGPARHRPFPEQRTHTMPAQSIASQAVSWLSVHEFVSAVISQADSFPTVGTPAWRALPDDHPAKLAAIFDAAQHHSLRLELNQEARAEASKAISGAADWPAIAREVLTRNSFYTERPWLRRAV